MQRPEALVLDLDGTLADSARDIAEACNAVLQEHGWPPLPLPVYRSAIGEGVVRLVEQLGPHLPLEALQALRDPERLMALVQRVRERYAARLLVHTRPFEGVPELLQGLAMRGVPLAVLSNKPQLMAERTVAALFPDVPFVAVEGYQEGRPRKPDPTVALQLAERMGLGPQRIGLLGDTPIDVQTARAAGMLPLGAGWGFRSPQVLREAGAAHVFATPAELLRWMQGSEAPHEAAG